MKVERQDFLPNRSCFFRSFVLRGVPLFDFIFILRCYVAKKFQLEKLQKHFNPPTGTSYCISGLFITDGSNSESLSQSTTHETSSLNMEVLSQTVSLDEISAKSLVPSMNVQECNRLYITSVRSLYTDRGGLLCPHFIGVNLSPAPSAVKSTDLYPIAFPFHSCRRVGHPPGCILLSHVAPGTGGDFTTTGAFSSET